MIVSLLAVVLASPALPKACEPPAARDVAPLAELAKKSGAVSVGLDSIATWCFDSGGAWTGGHKLKKGKQPDPEAIPSGDCAKAIGTCEGAKVVLTADLRALLYDALSDMETPYLGLKYPPKRSGLAERPPENADCRSKNRSELFAQAQARMDIARLANQAQSEYRNFRTWLYKEGLKCAQLVARGETDLTRRGLAVDTPVEKGGGTMQVDGGLAFPAGAATVTKGAPKGAVVVTKDSPRSAVVVTHTPEGAAGGAAAAGPAGATGTGAGGAAGASGSAAGGTASGGEAPSGGGPAGAGVSGTSGGGVAGAPGTATAGGTAGAGIPGAGGGGAGGGETGPSGARAGASGAGVAGAGAGAPGAGVGGAGAGTAGAGGPRVAAAGAAAGGAGAAGTAGGTGPGPGGTGAGGTGAPAGGGAVGTAGTGTAGVAAAGAAVGGSAAKDVPLGGPTVERQKALASSMIVKWRYLAEQRKRIEPDPDWALGFLASRELRECRCQRVEPKDIVARLEAGDRVAALQADDEKNTRCELCLQDSYPPWKVRVQKQCAQMDDFTDYELGVLQRSDDGNGLPPRCFEASRIRRTARPPPKGQGTASAGTTTPGKGGSAFIITRNPDQPAPAPVAQGGGAERPSAYAPIPPREDGHVYYRVFMSRACEAEVEPGPILARTGDLMPVPPGAAALIVKSPCGGLVEVYFGREEKPRVTEVFAKNQPLRLQFRKP